MYYVMIMVCAVVLAACMLWPEGEETVCHDHCMGEGSHRVEVEVLTCHAYEGGFVCGVAVGMVVVIVVGQAVGKLKQVGRRCVRVGRRR